MSWQPLNSAAILAVMDERLEVVQRVYRTFNKGEFDMSVVQPNVCTPDQRAGVQTGELFEITADGARSLHAFPRGFLAAPRLP